MGVVTATELPMLAGKPPSSSAAIPENPSPAVPDEEALSINYIPADGLSACLISPHRILVTAGATENDRVLPFSVIRYLDLSQSSNHTWTKPQHLRRKRGSTDIPVPRVEHSLTYVPHDARLYLFGGMKIDPDMGDICKTLFAFDPRNKGWQRVDPGKSRVKTDPDDIPGPRYAHSAVYVQLRERGSRPNSRTKPVPSLLIYGGYSSHDDHAPRSEVHALNVRTCKWALHRIPHDSLAPMRANHAAAVTKSQRFMVVHGGNHSDDDDVSVISDDLFVFDIQLSQWFIPEPNPASTDPPTARRRHSLVNGVGRHDGWLIMYGGHLREGNFSNDMYMCRIIEPPTSTGPKQKIGVVWEKIDVRGSIQRPLDERGKNALKRRTVAGGCLVPIPKLRKYILLGGKGELGLRAVPLLLDPYESDEIAISQSLPAEEEEEEEEIIPLRKRATAVNDSKNLPKGSSRDVAEEESDEEEDIIFDMQKNTIRSVPGHQKRRARSALSTPPGEKPSSARRTPSASATPSEKSPNSSSLVDKAGDGNKGSRPTTNVNSAVAVKLRIRSATKKKAESSPGDEDFMSATKKHPRRDENICVTPPTKRGRFLAPESTDDILPLDFGDDNDSEAAVKNGSADKSPSFRSEFLSASELARKGKKVGRGRGRGRGRSGATTRARSADDRAEEKRREAMEKLNEKNEERIAYLEAENHDLVKDNSELKKDIHDLNEQHKRLLEEVRALHVKENTRKKDTATAVEARGRKPNGSAPGSQVEINGRPSSSVTEADSLRGTIADLQAKITQKATEKETLSETVHDLEEEKRDVQKELYMMKNKVERTVADRDSYHQEMKELRKELVVLTKDKEAAEKRAQEAEEDLTLKKRDVELLKSDIMVEQQHRQDGKLELSTADRRVKVAQGQLAEAMKRKDDVEARERQLTAEMEKAKDRNGFLQRQNDDANARNRKLEDEKIEISSKLESMRLELHGKIKECSAALKDAEKSREALERERLKHANEDVGGDYIRMRAELERTKKECSMLRARCARFGRLKDTMARLREISEDVSAVFASEKEDEDIEVGLPRARAEDRVNGMMEQRKDDGGKESSPQEDKRENEGCSANQMKPIQGQQAEEDPVTISDSDDADEP